MGVATPWAHKEFVLGSETLGLRDLRLREEYRSDEGVIAEALFVPCLSVAIAYDRAAGFFTSHGLVTEARGLREFVVHSGRMRLVTSPILLPEDVRAIADGLAALEDVVERALLRQLVVEVDELSADRLALLSWLVAEERLDIRIAISTAGDPGLYHEKVAIFEDSLGDAVAAVGSSNETQGGLVKNFEVLDVYTSWDSTADRVIRKQANFERLWEGTTDGLRVLAFSDAVRQRLLEMAPPRNYSAIRPSPITESARPEPPDVLELRPYQREAIAAWQGNGYEGILSMATGTGKTAIALEGVKELRGEIGHPLAVVVLAPFIHLVDQWAAQAKRWGLRPIRCYGSSLNWVPQAQEALDFLRAGVTDLVCFIGTHASASLEPFGQLMRGVPEQSIVLIADEVHRLGAEALFGGLPLRAKYRLGLSATPERWEDPQGTDRLFGYFQGVVYEFGIKDAVEAGVLSRYEYWPEPVQLDADELEDYQRIVSRLVPQLELAPGKRDQVALSKLLTERSAVLDNARGKLERVRHLAEYTGISHSLFYCASRSQLSAVMDILWDRNVGARQFTGEEQAGIRAELLSALADGTVPALVAIRCLDEGVDVPEARLGVLLASSANPREFIQRRGRLLRLAPGKERAVIRDYIVVPEGGNEFERELVRREIRRVVEFTSASENRARAIDSIWPVIKRFSLMDEVGR
jgi:superfamily II DNA or RNA helicase